MNTMTRGTFLIAVCVLSLCQWPYRALVGACAYVLLWFRPDKNGKCRGSNLSSMASSTISLTTGVQRDTWYVFSVIRSLRGTVYVFFRLPCACAKRTYKINFTQINSSKFRICVLDVSERFHLHQKWYSHPTGSSFSPYPAPFRQFAHVKIIFGDSLRWCHF